MKKKITALALGAMLFALSPSTDAQQAGKIPRIGTLVVPPRPAVAPRFDAFYQRLRELSYIEGTNIVIESRYADGKPDRVPALAAELVSLKVNLIVSGGAATTRPLIEATKTIPIVMGQDDDPVGNGFVASLARPGGNVTGLSSLAPEISGKRLELLKEIIPQLSRVVILGSSTMPGNTLALEESERVAGAFKIQVQYQDVRGLGDTEPAFKAASEWRAQALLVLAVLSLIPTEHESSISRSKLGFQRPITYRNLSTSEGS